MPVIKTNIVYMRIDFHCAQYRGTESGFTHTSQTMEKN